MGSLISMLRELDLEKNNKEDIKYVLDFIAYELENKQKEINSEIKDTIALIKSSPELFHDDIDTDIISSYRIIKEIVG